MFEKLHLQCSSPSYWWSKHDLSIEGSLSLEGAAASSHGQDLEKSQSERRECERKWAMGDGATRRLSVDDTRIPVFGQCGHWNLRLYSYSVIGVVWILNQYLTILIQIPSPDPYRQNVLSPSTNQAYCWVGNDQGSNESIHHQLLHCWVYELIFSAETAGNLPLTLTFVKGGGGVVNPMQWTKSPNSAEPVRLRLRTASQLLTGFC